MQYHKMQTLSKNCVSVKSMLLCYALNKDKNLQPLRKSIQFRDVRTNFKKPATHLRA